jgi:hypothetical protein|tara:strand:- start:3719 stop:4936 length:1218 start_codon:yes stop_codon:yes gene_type:complete
MSFFKGLLQDEEFLVAAGLLQQGSQGKGIGEAIFPAIAQAGQVKKLFGEKKKRTTVKGADGYNYFVDTGERVLPDVVKEAKPKDDFYTLNKDEAIKEGLDVSQGQIWQKNKKDGKVQNINKINKGTKVTQNVKLPENKLLSKEAELAGETYGKKLQETLNNADKAFASNQNLTLLLSAADGLETGKFAPLIKDLMEYGNLVGVDLSWLSDYGSATDQLKNADVVNVLAGEQLFGKISQTKGSVSDKEMDAFGKMTTSLAMTPEGIKANVKIMEAMNNRDILKGQLIEDWTAGEDGEYHSLGRRKEVITANGEKKKLTFSQYWNDYVNGKDENGDIINTLFEKEELNDMLSLANSNLELMSKGEGSSYQFIQGLNGGKGGYIFIYDEELYNSSNGTQGVKILDTMK